MLKEIISGIKSAFNAIKEFIVNGAKQIPKLTLKDIIKIASGAMGFVSIINFIRSLFKRKSSVKPSTVVEDGISLGNPNNNKTDSQDRIIKSVSKSVFEDKKNKHFTREEYNRKKDNIDSMADKANFEKFESMNSKELTKNELNSPYAIYLRKVEKMSEPEIRKLLLKDKYEKRMKFNDDIVDSYFVGDEFSEDSYHEYDYYDTGDEFIDLIKGKYARGEDLDDFEMDCLKNHYIENAKKSKRTERRWQKRNPSMAY